MSYVQRRKITADKKPCIKQPVWLDLPATVLTATVPAKGQPPVMTFLLPPGALPRSQSDAHPPEQMLALFRSFPRASRQKELKMGKVFLSLCSLQRNLYYHLVKSIFLLNMYMISSFHL